MLFYAYIGHCQLTLSFLHYLGYCFNFQHHLPTKILEMEVISIFTSTVLL